MMTVLYRVNDVVAGGIPLPTALKTFRKLVQLHRYDSAVVTGKKAN